MEMTAGEISKIEEVFKKRLTLDKVRAPELQVELGSKSEVDGTQSLPPCE